MLQKFRKSFVRVKNNDQCGGDFRVAAVAPGPCPILVTFTGMGNYEGNLTGRVRESANLTITLLPATT